MPKLSQLPVNVRASSIAALPSADEVAALVDEATATADPDRIRDLLKDDLAEVSIWWEDDFQLVFLADVVIGRRPEREEPSE